VDDDPAYVELVRAALTRAGYATVGAATGAAALASASEQEPLAAIVDVNLPGVSGYEVCRELKERYRTPTIFISGYRTDAADRVVGLLMGADDYLVKPLHTDELIARLRRLLPLRGNAPVPSFVEVLTPREEEILQLLVDGLRPAEIAQHLVIAPTTVATHVQRILGKLDVRSRSAAVASAVVGGMRPRADEPPA
jgi:DNA-binding NarL/FixJ family response regulator